MRRSANSEGVVRALLEADWNHTHAIARATGLNRETVSRVLRRLAGEGLATARSAGPRREYALTDAGRRLASEWHLVADPTSIGSYRHRPTPIRAVQYDGTNLAVVRELVGDALLEEPDGTLVIQTLHRPMPLLPGSWAVKAPWGECWPILPDVFAQTYEPGANPLA